MASHEIAELEKSTARGMPNGSNPAVDSSPASDGETASQSSKSSKRRSRKRKNRDGKAQDGLDALREGSEEGDTASQGSRKSNSKKKRKRHGVNGAGGRRPSLSQPARDPRDSGIISAQPKSKSKTKSELKSIPAVEEESAETRSPSPMVDFDGLSRPSMRFP